MERTDYDEAWRCYGEEAAALLEHNETLYKKIVRKWCNPSEFDDMYFDCVTWRMPAFIHTWDPIKGAALETHICRNVNWYCMKWIKKFNARRGEAILADPPTHEDHSLFEMLQDLEPFDRSLLEWHYLEGYAVKDIAEANDWTISECTEYIDTARHNLETLL